MKLGAFSVSLAVKDIEASKLFYEKLGLQRQLKDRGLNMIAEADESSTGPASFMMVDPDGNTILVDQHV
jgi:lactoylglutathione lyase